MRAFALLLAVASLAGGSLVLTGSGRFGYRGETGVASRFIGSGLVRVGNTRAFVDAGLAASLRQHPGIAGYGLVAGVRLDREPAANWQLWTSALVQHEQWNDWQAGENRVGALLLFLPGPRLKVGLGAAWRAPVFDPDRYASPFCWRSPVPEWNLLYDVNWRLLQGVDWHVAGFVANHDVLALHNPQQFPFGIETEWRLSRCWLLSARAASAVNGLSAPLLSLSELDLWAGVTYAP